MAQLSNSAAQCAVDVREFVVERGRELLIPVFDKGRLLFEGLADVVVLSVALGSVYLLSNQCGLGLRHDGKDVSWQMRTRMRKSLQQKKLFSSWLLAPNRLTHSWGGGAATRLNA